MAAKLRTIIDIHKFGNIFCSINVFYYYASLLSFLETWQLHQHLIKRHVWELPTPRVGNANAT